jgi:hypothetical protein
LPMAQFVVGESQRGGVPPESAKASQASIDAPHARGRTRCARERAARRSPSLHHRSSASGERPAPRGALGPHAVPMLAGKAKAGFKAPARAGAGSWHLDVAPPPRSWGSPSSCEAVVAVGYGPQFCSRDFYHRVFLLGTEYQTSTTRSKSYVIVISKEDRA